MICRHGLRDVQDYAATVWGDSKIILGSVVYIRTSHVLLLTVSFDIVSFRGCQWEEFPNFPRVQRLLEVWLTRGRSSDSNIAKMRIDYVSEQNMWQEHILLPCTLHETNLAFPSYRLGRESTWFTPQMFGLRSRRLHTACAQGRPRPVLARR